jgi:hypothetical protein
MFEEDELQQMSVAKYDEFGIPHQYNYFTRFDFDGQEYAVFYPVEDTVIAPVILRIEGRQLVEILDPIEEDVLLEVLEEWLEDRDSTEQDERAQ